MKAKTFILLAAFSAAAVAANAAEKEYYQIYRVSPFSEGVKVENDRVFYEDANCKIWYDFWRENGNAGFVFENKTDKFITIDLRKSFFVKNGYSYSYFLNRVSGSSSSGNVVTTDATQANLAGVANALLLASDIASASMGGNVYAREPISAPQNVTTQSSSVSYYEQPTLILPAKCKASIGGYTIQRKVIWECDVDLFPNKEEKVSTTPYTLESTPFWFGNIITYRFDGGEDIVVKNNFYVKSVTNKREDLVTKFTYKSSTCPDRNATQGRWVFIERYTDGFYVKYTRGIQLY